MHLLALNFIALLDARFSRGLQSNTSGDFTIDKHMNSLYGLHRLCTVWLYSGVGSHDLNAWSLVCMGI